MKIVISGYVGKKITGIGRNLLCLIHNVSKNNKYVIYTNYDMEKEFANIVSENVTVKYYSVSKDNSWGNLLWTTFVFPFIVLKEKADVSLIPNFTLLLLKFKPTVVIMHDLIEFNVPNKFSKLKMFYRTKLADPITALRANHIITVSKNSKQDIMKFLKVNKNKIDVIYNGVNDINFYRNVEEKSEYENNNYILYVGTVDHPGKNVISVIKTFERLKDNDKYLGQLLIAGMPGAGYDFVENYVNNSLYKDQIKLLGYVSDNDLVKLYSNCDLFCFLSLYEGFGIPPLEALACGAKVVVSNNSSLPEVIGEMGYTVSPYDLDEIYNVVTRALDEEKPSSNKIREHLLKFKWEKLANKLENVLERSI